LKNFEALSTIVIVSVFLGSSVPLNAQSTREFSNPILAGFFPDPSICRVDSDYYLVNSTFAYFPGITVFHSRDLAHWTLIGYVLNRPEQLDLGGQGVSRGLFAPAIRFHNGLFYVTCTLVDIGGNFVATAKNPAGPWSNPVWLKHVDGIDPSLFFDDDGKCYIIYNSVAPGDKPLYDGHRTLRIREFNAESLSVTGDEHILVNGGTDIRKKPAWIEGPHIFKVNGIYTLIAAEGGTAEDHSEVVFKSTNVFGPYVPYEKNPILTQRNLDPNRKNPITCTGHADFVQTLNGDWWAVFLGCRPYEDDCYNTGRETFLAPVQWIDGWPIINPGQNEVQYHYALPMALAIPAGYTPLSGNFVYRDEFTSDELAITWQFLRTPHERWYGLQEKKGSLALKVRPETCAGDSNPSFLGHRQQHLEGAASVKMDFVAARENEKAGIVVFQNEFRFYYLCESVVDGHPVAQLYRSIDSVQDVNDMELIAAAPLQDSLASSGLLLKIEAHGNTYGFSYGSDSGHWSVLKDNVDATYLSTKKAGGFVGCMYALYATSLGRPSSSSAYYDWFEYNGNDSVFR
jgi:xylan 1,4-beta-xylosidase